MRTSLCLGLGVLLALTATAAADPAPAAPAAPAARRAPSRACERSGDVMFESELKADDGVDVKAAKLHTQLTRVWDTGGWSHEEHDGTGKLVASTTGCMSPREIQPVHSDVFNVKWTRKPAQAACDAMSNSHTEYRSYGKVIAEDRVCNSQVLDDESAKALADIIKRVAKAMTPPKP